MQQSIESRITPSQRRSLAPAPYDSMKRVERLRRAFWIAALVFGGSVALTARPQNAESAIGGSLIFIAALIPIFIWARNPAQFPLFPVYASTHIGAFAFPLLYSHPIVMIFPPATQLVGGLSVAGFLVLGTFVWYQVWKRQASPRDRCLVLEGRRADIFFLFALTGGIIMTAGPLGNWFNLPPGLYSILRAVSLALNALACFALSYRSGDGSLSAQKRVLFRILFIALLLSTLIGLLLINTISLVVVAALGYMLGARRIPWRLAIVTLGAFALLQAGKGDMRSLYWGEEEDTTIQPLSYPSFLRQWVSTSIGNISSGHNQSGDETQSLIERASLMQLLLYVQTMTPDDVPYMKGETYAIIPTLLVPRIFDPEKIASHEGTYLLNIHYGFQTREATDTTTIGFGLLNEAYANFGYLGMAGLAVVMGLFYAAVARWAENTPVLSFRSLFAIIVASYSFQSEFASGVYVSALFQSTVALCGLALVFMRAGPCQEGARSIAG